MRRLFGCFFLMIFLVSCHSINSLRVIVAIDDIFPIERNVSLDVILQISSPDDLAKEISNLSDVTYAYISCPIGDKDIYLSEDAHFSLIGALVGFRNNDYVGGFNSREHKYVYRVDSTFEDATTQNMPEKFIGRKKIIDLINAKKQLSCRIVILRSLSSTYMSNIFYLPKEKVLAILNNMSKDK